MLSGSSIFSTGEEIIHCVFAYLLCWLLVHLGIQMWFKKDSLNSDLSTIYVKLILVRFIEVISWFDHSPNQILWVSYFTICQFGVQLVMEQWFKQTLYLSCITKIHFCIFIVCPVIKSDTTNLIISFFQYWYICAFKWDLRNTRWTVI